MRPGFRGLRPPPSAWNPYPASFCRLFDPLFCGTEGPVYEALTPFQLLVGVEFLEELVPNSLPGAVGLPLLQPPPASGRRGIFIWQILPPRPGDEDPHDPLDHGPGSGPGPPVAFQLREQRPYVFPLLFGQSIFSAQGAPP